MNDFVLYVVGMVLLSLVSLVLFLFLYILVLPLVIFKQCMIERYNTNQTRRIQPITLPPLPPPSAPPPDPDIC